MSIAIAPERALRSVPPSGSLRLAIVASHPVQYQAPWYRALAGRLDLQVLFAHRVSPADHARGGFGVGFEWDTPLLEGYSFEWLVNTASRPGVDHASEPRLDRATSMPCL